MNNINPINLGVASRQFFTKENNEELAKESSKKEAKESNKKEISAKEVLNFLAATNNDIMPVKVKKTVDVSKYVNAEQATRIEDFMKDFEAKFDVLKETALNEFPDITNKTASDIALATINQTY